MDVWFEKAQNNLSGQCYWATKAKTETRTAQSKFGLVNKGSVPAESAQRQACLGLEAHIHNE